MPWRAAAKPPAANAPRAGSDAQQPLATSAPRAGPDAQRQSSHSVSRRRADPRGRRRPQETQPSARGPLSANTPPPAPAPRRGATRLPCLPLSLRQCSTRRPSPHLSRRLILTQGRRIDENWTPYHLPAPPTTATAAAATARAGCPRRPPTPPDDTAPADTAPAKLPDSATPLSQPSLRRWFPMREPGPAALPRAAAEHTEHDPAAGGRT